MIKVTDEISTKRLEKKMLVDFIKLKFSCGISAGKQSNDYDPVDDKRWENYECGRCHLLGFEEVFCNICYWVFG